VLRPVPALSCRNKRCVGLLDFKGPGPIAGSLCHHRVIRQAAADQAATDTHDPVV